MLLKKRYPIILLVIIIFLFVISYLVYTKNNGSEKIAKIYKDKKLLYTIDICSKRTI